MKRDLSPEGIMAKSYTVENRETKEVVSKGTQPYVVRDAIAYIKENPEATLCFHALSDRMWKCKTTGKIRTDHIKDIESPTKEEGNHD
jgi:hypothetical protein